MHTRRFWVDTETTGMDSRRHFAFQLAYFIEEDGRILVQRNLAMRPDNYDAFEFTREAEEVHGWSRSRIIALESEAAQYRTLIADLAQYAQDKLTVAGYNVDFDIHFLKGIFYRGKPVNSKYTYGEYGKFFDGLPFDVLQFAQGLRVAGLLPLPNLKLETVCAHFGIDTWGAHAALTDILNTRAVFEKLLETARH